MKKFFLILVLILTSFSATFSQDVKVDPAFLVIYNQVIDLNKNRFEDINMIPIGATILFPARSGDGTEVWVANAPKNGVHDCFWVLTERYLKNELETTIVKATTTDNTRKKTGLQKS